MQGNLSEQGAKALRSNLQQAQTARALQLLVNDRDFDKRANGVNASLPGALVGDLDPKTPLKQERVYHRTFINMSAAGHTNQEIADFTGFSIATVSNCLKQPWAREYLINEAKKTVQDEMKAFLEAEVLPSLRTLKTVRDGQEVRNQDRISASNALLDRFLGKPVQPMTTDAKPVASMSDEELRAKVQAEITASQPN